MSLHKEILLGSGSPRRRELLNMMGINFRVVSLHNVDENYPSDMKPEQVPVYLSKLKGMAYINELKEGQLLITADTVVISDGTILGKPNDYREAFMMLRRLSGRQHSVVTGVTLSSPEGMYSFSEKTLVTFDELSNEMIDYYVHRYIPLDKAGAYGIQEWIGVVGVKGIAGCYYNVMGLPTAKLYMTLQKLGHLPALLTTKID